MNRRFTRPTLVTMLCLSVLGTIGLFWLSDVPLGVPGEWTWTRILVPNELRLNAAFGWMTAAVVGAAYCLVARVGARRIGAATRRERGLWLVGLAVAGFGWLWVVQESPAPEVNQFAKSVFVTYYRGPDGYFDEARYQMTDVGSFLAGYEKRMTEGDVLHFGTHPPGMALFHRGLIHLCASSPALTRMVLATQPSSAAKTFDIIDETQRRGSNSKVLLPEDRAAIWLAVLLIQGVGVATVIPLYLLARRTVSREAAWMAVAFWPLVPSLAVFLPKSDAMFPCLGTAFLALWLYGRGRRSPLMCVAAGLVMWLGMFLSLALSPFALLAAILTFVEMWLEGGAESQAAPWRERITSTAKSAGWALAGFAVPVLLLWLVWEANLVRIWSWNYHNHAAFYDRVDQYPRTWWKWLLVNPLELIFGVGAPVTVLSAAACLKLRPWKRWDARTACAVSCFAVWAILWVSGKNMGEAARLWLVLMPWPVWIAAGYFDAYGNDWRPAGGLTRSTATSAPGPVISTWLVALAAQAVACAATVSRVNGFDFGL